MEDIEHYNIPIYNFPYDVEEDDEDTIEENSELRVILHLRLSITIFTLFFRPFYHSLLSVVKKKSLSMAVRFVVVNIPGVLLKLIILNTLTLVV